MDLERLPSDAERRLAMKRVQEAVLDNVIKFDELDDRFEIILAAGTVGEIDKVLNDLPQIEDAPAPYVAPAGPTEMFKLLGSIKVGGERAVPEYIKAKVIVGDALIDLSNATIGPNGVDIFISVGVGDARVIVPDGARVQVTSTTAAGDHAEDIVAAVASGPVIRIKTKVGVGDVGIYSLSQLPVGRLQQLWRKLTRNDA